MKKFKNNISLVFAAVAVLLVSCERTADIDLPEVDPKIVLTCFIGPELTDIQAVIRYSNPIFGESDGNTGEFTVEPNMLVTISNGSITDTLEYSFDYETYSLSTADFPIVAGGTYTMTVKSPSGEVVTATTKVPNNAVTVQSASLELDSVPSGFGYYEYYGEIKMAINDPDADFNYYRLVYYYDTDGFGYSYWGQAFSNDDKLSNGVVNSESRLYYWNGSNNVMAKAFVMNCSEEYYRFHWSLNNYNGDSPFSEPAIIYSNVEGGLGCFGGYNKVELDF